ncbi:outer membrane beta-barrel protein [Halomonas getboli]|uniref:outer membrane beta-barrel protein n=1 Tax=Halomonas getboli TaxID=2935862 RepID=UPI0020003B26|nr:outer membrane beta-barrel protein [Halomonas getboli]MCK2185199.1 porin family protein [Halomonas getboli]
MTRKTPLRSLLAATLATGLAITAAPAFATGTTGVYLGGALGQMHGDDDFDDEADMVKLTAGYNVGWLPFLDLGAELGYVNGDTLHGEVDGRSGSLDVDAFEAMGVAGLSFGPLGVYAKAGMADWDAERRGRGLTHDYSGTDPVYGLGARVELLDITGRVEIERLDTDEIGDIDMVTAGVVYTF